MTMRNLTDLTPAKRRAPLLGMKTALMVSSGALALTLASPALAQPAVDALPTNGVVTDGVGTIGTPVGSSLNIGQTSDRMVINWDTFDIGQDASVNFNQTGAHAVAVNRVVGSGMAPSQIFGDLTAQGTVVIINGNGVMFGGGANVDVGGLIATSSSLDTTAFMASGALNFSAGGGGAVTIASGAGITVNQAGLAAFVAPNVSNSGTINAVGGRVILGGGEVYTLDLAGDGLLSFGLDSASPLVTQAGEILAAGGVVQLSAAAASGLVSDVINVSGVIEVGAASQDGNAIILSAGGGGVTVSAPLAIEGDISIDARRIHGAGDIGVTDGALALNLNVDGADTTGESLIADALGVIGSVDDGTTINLGAGVYAAGALINTADVTIDGGGVASISATQNGENGLSVGGNGDGAVITGLEIFGQATSAYNTFAWGGTVTRGIVVANGADNVTVTGNTIHDVRNGILIDGRNVTGGTFTGNTIDNTKSAISVQYTDASDLTISGNSQGAFGNEWGVNLHLNQVWDGVTLSPSAGALGANPSAAVQQHILDMSQANNGMSVYDQAYSASNRSHVNVAVGGGANAQGSLATPINSVQGGINAVVDGGFVSVADGTYNIGSSRIIINKSLTLTGQSEAGVIIDGRGVGGGLGTMLVSADDVSLSNFTLYGADSGVNNFGIKVQPDPIAYSTGQRLYNFAISDVTVRGSTRAEIDLNGVNGATITNFTADGRRVSDDNFQSGGAGIQITDSQNVTISGATTLGNAWGSVAIYQTNRAGGYDQLTDNITIDGTNSSFAEALGVFVQSYSTLHPQIGELNLIGFDYAVRNTGHRSDGNQFTYFRTDLDDAIDFALALGGTATGSIEGWSGTDYTNQFTVVEGLAIGSAVRDARDGADISVGAGTYVENIAISQSGVTLTSTDGRDETTIQGVAGAGAGQTVLISGNDTTLGGAGHGFTIVGFDNGNPASEDAAIYITGNNSGTTIRGNDIVAGGDVGLLSQWGMALTDLTVDGNIFSGKTYVGATPATGSQFVTPNVSRQLVAIGGGTGSTDVSFTNNQVTGDSGLNTAVTVDSSDATITGNTFASTTGGSLFRARGTNVTVSGNIFETAGLSASGAVLTLGTATAATNAAFEAYLAANALDSDGAYAESVTGSTRDLYRSVQGAVNQSAAGGVVNILEGEYAGLVTIGKSITLSGAGMDETALTGGIALTNGSPFTGLTLQGFTLSGDGGGNALVRNGRVTNLTIDDVRFDAQDVAGRHGFAGGQFGGAISITNSEFIGIRGFSAFDTSTGGTATAITSVNFSDNLLDGTVGHVTFRQATPTANVTISGNTVQNVGDTTDLSSAIFKVFGAATVDFEGNTVTGVGASPNKFTAGVADGAALLVRGVGTLNITDNVFTDNQQAFLVGAGNALPTVTNLSGNTFTNNAYDIFLPASTGGVLNFGEGNAFVSGAATQQHLTWVGAAGVDLTNVTFDGELGSAMSNAELFALEDRIVHGVDVAGAGFVTVKEGHVFVTEGSGAAGLVRGVGFAGSGDTVNVGDGTYALASTLDINTDGVSLVGQSQAGVILDATNASTYGVRVKGDDVSLSGFTLTGGQGYGIKVEADGPNGVDERNTGFSIADVTVSGTRRNGLDLNAALDATVDGVTISGVTNGVGIAITDSANVTITDTTTSGNAWGGVGLYQRNNVGGGGSNQRLAGIVIDDTNSFGEVTGVYLQSYASALHDVGSLTIEGYDFVVQNDNLDGGATTYAFFDRTLQDAIDRGVNLTASSDSVVGGWSGTGSDGNLYVGIGDLISGGQAALSIQTAFDASGDGDTINIGSGDYDQSAILDDVRTLLFGDVSLNDLGLTANASGSAVSGAVTASGEIVFDGDVTLAGDYAAASFAANGATTLGEDVGVTADNVTLASVDGAHGLTVAGGDVALGAVGSTTALASLNVSGDSIVTEGATTTGAQSYSGAVTLAGDYAASGFTASGATTLGDAVSITADGVSLATVDGAHALTVSADTVALGAVGSTTALASLDVTADSIVTNGATTTGAQSYAGGVTFSGDYITGAGAFTVSGAATLADDTAIQTDGGAIVLGDVNGSTAGGQDFSVDAGDGSATLGSFGAGTRLGAVLVQANQTVLTGNVYAGASLSYLGGDGSTVRLTRVSTTFNTTQSDSAAGDILIQPHLIGTTAGAQSVVFIAGAGVVPGANGDITLTDAGTDGLRLGGMAASGDDLSAQTVKLAGDYGSVLSGDQVFSDETLDVLGNVDAQVGGDEAGSIVAGGSVFIEAGGSATGTLTAGGPVTVSYGTGSDRIIDANGPVAISSDSGVIGGAITSGGAVTVNGGGAVSSLIVAGGDVSIDANGPITSSITTPSTVTLTSNQPLNVTVDAGAVNVNAPGGTVTGDFDTITTPPGVTVIVNGEAVIGESDVDVRQILTDSFLVPAGGVVGATGLIELPVGLAIALIAPAGEGEGQRRPILVNDIARLGELLRLGYTAIVIQIGDEDEEPYEQELDIAQTEDLAPAA